LGTPADFVSAVVGFPAQPVEIFTGVVDAGTDVLYTPDVETEGTISEDALSPELKSPPVETVRGTIAEVEYIHKLEKPIPLKEAKELIKEAEGASIATATTYDPGDVEK